MAPLRVCTMKGVRGCVLPDRPALKGRLILFPVRKDFTRVEVPSPAARARDERPVKERDAGIRGAAVCD